MTKLDNKTASFNIKWIVEGKELHLFSVNFLS